MDLRLLGRVIWRFKWIVATGFVLAVALAVLSTARVSFAGGMPKLTYRKAEVWQSQTALLITQQGFPWGRTFGPATATPTATTPITPGVTYVEAGGFANLASLYARLASSDAVRARIRLAPGESLSATPVLDATNHTLPIVGIIGVAPSPAQAIGVSVQAARAFQRYIDAQQRAANIPSAQRVVLQVINEVGQVQLVAGRKKTLPIVTFVGVLMATLVLAFVLENARPRVRAASAQPAAEPQSLQRTA